MTTETLPVRSRPTPITVIAWVFIGFGALALVGGVFAAIVSVLMPFPDEPAAKMIDAPLPFQITSRIFDHFGVIAAVQVAVALLMIASGAAFLRLQPWSLVAIEAITWLALLYTLVFGAFWIWTVATLWNEAPSGAGVATLFFPLFIAFGAVMVVMFAVPLVVIIRVVRGRTVRDALVIPTRS